MRHMWGLLCGHGQVLGAALASNSETNEHAAGAGRQSHFLQPKPAHTCNLHFNVIRFGSLQMKGRNSLYFVYRYEGANLMAEVEQRMGY